jgi:hypothetical protein
MNKIYEMRLTPTDQRRDRRPGNVVHAAADERKTACREVHDTLSSILPFNHGRTVS